MSDYTKVLPVISLNYTGESLDSIEVGDELYVHSRDDENTCHSLEDDYFLCSKCDFQDVNVAPYEYNYCPNCGRKVVDA